VLARIDRPKALGYLGEALLSDVDDIQGGTTAEGVHLGAMAATVDLVQRVCTGVEVTGGVLRFNPRLPERLARLEMCIRYRGHMLDLTLTRDAFTVRGTEAGPTLIRLALGDDEHVFEGGETRTFDLTPPTFT